MKKLRMILPVLAFLFAIGAAFGSVLVQTGFYDSNGISTGGAVEGDIDQIGEDCQVQAGTICTVNEQWAFNTAENAELNKGSESNPMAAGLLKYTPQ